jgi:hypothetical protein
MMNASGISSHQSRQFSVFNQSEKRVIHALPTLPMQIAARQRHAQELIARSLDAMLTVQQTLLRQGFTYCAGEHRESKHEEPLDGSKDCRSCQPNSLGQIARQALSFILLMMAWTVIWTLSLRASNVPFDTPSSSNVAKTPSSATVPPAAVGVLCGERRCAEYSFAAIDSYVLGMPKSAEKSPEKVAAYLMRVCVNDIEKARAVTRWISANIQFDYAAARGDARCPSNHPDSVFASRRAVAGGYASLFVRMMKSLGIEAVSIAGWKKGFAYIPGDSSTLQRHVWNAFRAGGGRGSWYVVDVPVYKEVENSEGAYKTTYADTFFCIAPEQLVLTHFPDNPSWQLLETPISREEFDKGVHYFGSLYGYPVMPSSHTQYALSTKQRTLTLEFIGFHGAERLNLAARVYERSQTSQEHPAVREVRNAARWTQEPLRDGRIHYKVYLKLPQAGEYNLEITATERIVKKAFSVIESTGREQYSGEHMIGYAVKPLVAYSITVESKKALAVR